MDITRSAHARAVTHVPNVQRFVQRSVAARQRLACLTAGEKKARAQKACVDDESIDCNSTQYVELNHGQRSLFNYHLGKPAFAEHIVVSIIQYPL